MKAAVFRGKGQFAIEEWPTPEAGPGQVLVKVAACGVCHTDLHYIDHGVPTFKQPPLVLGHEAAGTIAAVGQGAGKWKVGDRVLLPAVVTCGTCYFCRVGRENICESMVMFGNNVDGAYAEYVAAPAKDIFYLPESVPLTEGSIIADALSTPYHAVKNRGNVRPGDQVVVFGCGGVGMNTVQLASACGGIVTAVDINDWKLEQARSLGAVNAINAKNVPDVSKAVRKATDGGADTAFECIGKPETIEAAFGTLRKGGRLVVVGYTHEKVCLPASKIMYFEQEVVGSLGCRPVDYPPLIRLAASGKIRVKDLVTHRFPLADIGKALDLLRDSAAQVLRAVVVP